MQTQTNILFLILASAAFALLMIAFITAFLYITQKRSFRYTENIGKIKKEFDDAVLGAQIEVQANTLQQISDEIHDNIGQRLSLTKMNLGRLSKDTATESVPLLEETSNILSEIIAELRHLSKSISPRHLNDFGLTEAIAYQIDRINKADEIKATFSCSGLLKAHNPQVEVVMFRMIQELMNNAVKHSECKHIDVNMTIENNTATIIVKDDGKGFDRNSVKQESSFKDGTGLHSIENKAKSINCSIAFSSGDQGTVVRLVKNFEENVQH